MNIVDIFLIEEPVCLQFLGEYQSEKAGYTRDLLDTVWCEPRKVTEIVKDEKDKINLYPKELM